MVAIERTTGLAYSIHLKPVALEAVVKEGERVMPDQFINNFSCYYEWLKPIVGDNVSPYPPLIQVRNVKSSS
jgi:6-phosphofructokinase 1